MPTAITPNDLLPILSNGHAYLHLVPPELRRLTTFPDAERVPIILLDLPTGSALHWLEDMQGSEERNRTVILTSNDHPAYLEAVRSYHVGAIISANASAYERGLRHALETVAAGDRIAVERRHTFTQMLVLRRTLAGRSNREVAEELHLSPKTITSHFGPLLTEYGCPTRTVLVACILTGARRG